MLTESFSQRIGVTPKRQLLQLTEMDDALRNSLWNKIVGFFGRGDHVVWDKLTDRLAEYFYKVPVDNLPYNQSQRAQWLKKRFYEAPWNGVYDLLEFLVSYWGLFPYGPGSNIDSVRKTFNNVLESEASGYRFMGNVLTPISSTAELEAVDSAVTASRAHGLPGAETHLQASAKLLSLRPVPDYRNSIKESISAVESVAKTLGGGAAGGLAGALEELQKKVELHGALKSAFLKLYGYTSDSSGIRHAILDDSTVGFDEAKYMLVSCSAFIYYLVEKQSRAALGK